MKTQESLYLCRQLKWGCCTNASDRAVDILPSPDLGSGKASSWPSGGHHHCELPCFQSPWGAPDPLNSSRGPPASRPLTGFPALRLCPFWTAPETGPQDMWPSGLTSLTPGDVSRLVHVEACTHVSPPRPLTLPRLCPSPVCGQTTVHALIGWRIRAAPLPGHKPGWHISFLLG